MADDFARQLLDALYNPETQPPQQPSRPLREKLAGAAETAATLGSGLLASVPAGLAGLTQMIPTRGHRPSVNRAAEKIEEVQSALTRLPRTEAGQEYLGNTVGALSVLGMPAEFLGEQTLKLTGSPFLATTANVGLDPVNYIGIPGTGKALVSGTKAAGRTIAAAPRVAGEMISDLVMPTPRAQAQRGAIHLGPQIPEFQPQTTLGLVSRADEALAALPRNKGTGAEFLRELEKTPGVRMAELEDRGLVEALSGMGKVTKADVIKALQDNPPVQLKEVMLGSESLTPRQKLTIEYDRAREESGRVGGSTNPSYIERIPESNRTPEEQRLLEAWNRVDQSLEESWLSENPPTKYGQYTLPGGENYREILLTLPGSKPSAETEARLRAVQDRINELRPIIDRQPLGVTAERKEFNTLYDERDRLIQEREGVNYKSGHWSEPNVLAHARISDRTGPNGEKILHVEEVQSDWHQEGRKKGYKTKESLENWYNKNKLESDPAFADLNSEQINVLERNRSAGMGGDDSVPDAPFKKNWHELMMRRLVDYAAKNGYDRIAITPGAEQASRYDLSKHITDLSYKRNDDGTYRLTARDKDGRLRDLGPNNTESQLSNIVGKDIAEKIVKGEGEGYPEGSISQGFKKLSGLDLQVGGEGMKGFYDKILPTYLNELGKPYGVKVGQMEIEGGSEISRGPTGRSMVPTYTPKTVPVHSFDITPQMREAIKSKGLPLYAKGGSVHISDNPDTMQLELQVGGAVKAAKAASKAAAKAAEKEGLSVPFDIPRAPAKSKEEIRPIAERMARQMTGEFVRLDPKESINPAGKSLKRFLQEKEFEKDYITRPTKQVTEPEFADIEKQLGMVKFGIPGDTTIANQELIQAGPYMLDIPSPQHGGPRFPLGGEGAWASNNPQAANVQKRAVEMSEYFNAPVMGQYIAMGPTGSNFAQHFADASLRAIDLSKMSKSQIEQFNELIRKGSEDSGPRPSFPGIQDKDQAYFWLSWDPELRKHFNALMVKPKYTQPFGLPDGRVILDAITEPALRNKEISTSGFSQFDLDPSIRPEDIPLSEHPTYTHLIPMKKGAPVRQTRYPIPAELEFPDVTKFIRENYRPSEFTPTFQKASPRQKIDQQAIDEIKMYEEMMKSLTGKKKGGAVKKQAGGAIKAAVKAAKPTAEQAAKMAEQRAELVLRSRAMQELKDQFENLPQPPKGFLSSESILQRMDEIRRREATPSGEQIPLLKKGGAIEMQVGGALKAAAKAAERAAKAAKPEVLPAAEREANLKKMLKSSHVKRPVYHGTNKTDTLADESGQAIRQFDSYVNWFTQDPYHASGYATQDGRQIEGAATYPAYLSLQRPLHLRGDLNDKTTYAQFRKETGLDVRPGPYEDEVVDGVEQMIPRWWITNSPSFADAARAAGFDGVIANEGGTKTFGIFYHEPGKIKSAIGNRGTFDVTNPDITKKRGGSVKFTDNLDTMRLAVQKRK